jgi:hypothetical protein
MKRACYGRSVRRVLLLVLCSCASEAAPVAEPTSAPPPVVRPEQPPEAEAPVPATPAPPPTLPCGPIPTEALATTQSEEGPGCTVHRPATLGAGGLRHPVIVWGNGTGAVVSVYDAAFEEWAASGFIVAAANTSNGQGAGKALVDCLDHVMKTYAANVCERAGASGHSQGGGGAIMTGRDPRIVATAPVQPYIQQGYGGFDRASIGAQRGAMLLLSGSADGNAVPSLHQKPVFEETNVPVFWATLEGGDHYFSAYELSGYREIVLAWFRLQLMGDETHRAKFYGPSCTYCASSEWKVERRGI